MLRIVHTNIKTKKERKTNKNEKERQIAIKNDNKDKDIFRHPKPSTLEMTQPLRIHPFYYITLNNAIWLKER